MLLVTGITGHSGRYFFTELEKANYSGIIRCVIRNESNAEFLKESALKTEKVVIDLDTDTFDENIMAGVTDVVHISHLSHTPKLLKAALKKNVSKFISGHTTGIYSRFKVATEEYKKIEREVENILHSGAITYICLRPTMIYGDMCDKNISVLIRIVDRFRIIPVINGGNVLLQPVNARDLVDGI